MKVLHQSYALIHGRNVVIEKKEVRALRKEQDFIQSISEERIYIKRI